MNVYDRNDRYVGKVSNGYVYNSSDNYVGKVSYNGKVEDSSGYVGTVYADGKISSSTYEGYLYREGSVNDRHDKHTGKVSGITMSSSTEERYYAGGAALLLLLQPSASRAPMPSSVSSSTRSATTSASEDTPPAGCIIAGCTIELISLVILLVGIFIAHNATAIWIGAIGIAVSSLGGFAALVSSD
jgi:hypothetical protein